MSNRPFHIFCLALIIASVIAFSAHCKGNNIEFRLVLSPEELKGKSFDVIKNGDQLIYVWKFHYLSDRDLEKVEIRRSAAKANSLMMVLKFNKDGRKRLYRFTKRFAKRQVAILVEGKLVTTPLVWIPYFIGDSVATKWPGKERELFEFASRVNNANPSVISLYIEEQANYNEAAADEWADYYSNLNNYIEEKRKMFAEDSSQVESDRELN